MKVRVVALIAVTLLQLPLVGAIAARAGAFAPSLGTQTIDRIQGPDRTSAESTFGIKVAISADGLSALIADPTFGFGPQGVSTFGAVNVYTRADASSPWTPQGSLPQTPGLGEWFGTDVALSSDGMVALVRLNGFSGGAGNVQAFERSGSGWVGPQSVFQGANVDSIALDGDGTTAVIGALPPGAATPNDGIHVIDRNGATWTERQRVDQGSAVRANPDFGPNVAIASDGLTMVFSTHDNLLVATRQTAADDVGAPQPLSALLGDGQQAPGHFVSAIAITPDAGTIVATDMTVSPGKVGVWVRTSDGAWAYQQTLTGGADTALFGAATALSASGDRLVVGDPHFETNGDPAQIDAGRAFAYERRAGVWSDAETIDSPYAHAHEAFGLSVASDAAGTTLMVGSIDSVPAPFSSAYSWSTDTPAPDGSPDARDDAVTTTQDTAVDVRPLANDAANDLATTTYDTVSDHGGTVQVDNVTGVVTYTPPPMFVGTDDFSYTSCDDDPQPVCDTAVVTIHVDKWQLFDEVGTGAANVGPGVPLVGDFNADHRSDVLWYAPGAAQERLFRGASNGFSPMTAPSVNATFTPIVGNFNGDRSDDVLWYSPGAVREALWFGGASGFTSMPVSSVNATFTPIVGDFNGDMRDDVLWYPPGAGREALWLGAKTGFTSAPVSSVNGTFKPVVGDFNGDLRDDILWYAPGATREELWLGASSGFTHGAVSSVNATFTPVVGDFNGDHRDDVLWYAAGAGHEALWLGGMSGFISAAVPSITATYEPVVGNFNGDAYDDVLWVAPGGSELWRGGPSSFNRLAVRGMGSGYHAHSGD
ncbi:MAG: hypothetical protein JWL83_432, partial [Actinomycetia bacterium]|nr:hypothetical protein [Actinomycetes bacterium]